MEIPNKKFWRQQWSRVSRRDLFRSGGMFSLGYLLGKPEAQAAPPPALQIGPNIFQSIGVRPMINARGTITVITGSQTLPEVKAAMDAASRHFVQVDELADAVGKRLAELTGAPWGLVTTGASGALTVATVACVAGADPDKLELLANRQPGEGVKYDVIIPQTSRNAYDHSIRAVGVNVIEPRNIEELEAALGPQTAMVMLLSGGGGYAEGPMSIDNVAKAAHRHGVPVLVDAAAEQLTVPNIHLQRGADMVIYSGGKCIRGPQCAGLLLGRKDLVQAAWVASAPHHTVCRGLKTGKEEIMGMLAAVEMWMKRNHPAEEKLWTSWLEHIEGRLKSVPGLTMAIRPARGVDNRTPALGITWDRNVIDLTGDELEQILWDGEPRVSIGGRGSFLPFPPDSGNRANVSPYMLVPGEEKILAERLYQVFSKAPKPGARKKPATPAGNLSGHWDVHVEFVSGAADHQLTLEQSGNDVSGMHQGQAAIRELKGTIDGNDVVMRSSYTRHGARLNYTFTGKLEQDRMGGHLLVGEYGEGRWSAKRHQNEFPRGGRPIAG